MNHSAAGSLPLRSQFLLLSLPCLQFLMLGWLVFHYAIDVPLEDQWEFVPVLGRFYEHELRFQDLWMQHNEHRLLFPRLVMLGCAWLSGWNLRWEMGVSVLLALGLFGVYVALLRRTAQEASDAGVLGLIPVVGLAVFSLRQCSNWMWGWQLQIFMNVLAVVGGISVLTQTPLMGKRLVMALACGIVATYSFTNGLLYWFVGGFVLAVQPPEKAKRAHILVWILTSAGTIGAYFYQYAPPQNSPSLLFSLLHPGLFLNYVLAYLGGLLIVKQSEGMAVGIGMAGVLLLAWSAWRLRKAPISHRVLTPYFALALYAVLSAMMCGIGRAELGVWQALESRYTTISELFWIATMTLFFLALRQSQSEAGNTRGRMQSKWALIVFGIALVLGSLKDVNKFQKHYVHLLPAQQALQRSQSDSEHLLYPDSDVVAREAETLKRYHLNIYRGK